jgi:prolyl 4-hydroxylase
MIGYFLALLPVYVFLYQPISQFFFPSSLQGRHGLKFNASFIAPTEDPSFICPEHRYTTQILSREPLVLYLEGWLGEEEIGELLDIRYVLQVPSYSSPTITYPHPYKCNQFMLTSSTNKQSLHSRDQFSTSVVSTGPDTKIDPSIRLSEVATLTRTPTVQCIESRARSLQGWSFSRPSHSSVFEQYFFTGPSAQIHLPAPVQPSHEQGGLQHGKTEGKEEEKQEGLMLERLKIQKYGPGGHYTYHYDWQGAGQVDRVSSFMVYVDANCTGGGTAFPRLPIPADKKWCQFIECDEGTSETEAGMGIEDGKETKTGVAGEGEKGPNTGGVIFKPIRGNAVYWENLRSDGTGYTETWHAGLPVLTWTKVGLNIWSWYRF